MSTFIMVPSMIAILNIQEAERVKPWRLMELTAYVFAGSANKVGGGLRLRAFHGGLRRLTTAALWYRVTRHLNLTSCLIAHVDLLLNVD